MNIEIAEGLVIGPEDRLVVNLKEIEMEAEDLDSFVRELRKILGDRFIVLHGGMEIAKVECA